MINNIKETKYFFQYKKENYKYKHSKNMKLLSSVKKKHKESIYLCFSK